MDRNKKTLIIIAVFGLVIAIVGGTLAYWRWQSSEAQKTVVNFTIGSDFSCADDNSVKPNAPELDTGMIPVVIANDGTVTTVSKDDSNWYDYSSKKWANVVLVNSSSRSNYLNTTGVTIPEDNILAYYVWIPRYKYKIWETGMSSAGKEQEIEIVFESKDTDKSTGTQVDEYRTHPAFTFGDVELNGIWVGKFEMTGDETTPTVKPNSRSFTEQDLYDQFVTALKFAGGTLSGSNVTFTGNSTYGLTTQSDSHMLKNSEWGAVAYLSHSKYGINQKIRTNNYYNDDNGATLDFTGCGANVDGASESTTCDIVYGGALSYPQSTTGNISGIFDMSGGVWEYVMGYYSGASTTWGATSEGNYARFSSKPDSKYYDDYTSTDILTACNGGICYGHALSETANWYNNVTISLDAVNPWINDGGSVYEGELSNIFYVNVDCGVGSDNTGYRGAIVVR